MKYAITALIVGLGVFLSGCVTMAVRERVIHKAGEVVIGLAKSDFQTVSELATISGKYPEVKLCADYLVALGDKIGEADELYNKIADYDIDGIKPFARFFKELMLSQLQRERGAMLVADFEANFPTMCGEVRSRLMLSLIKQSLIAK